MILACDAALDAQLKTLTFAEHDQRSRVAEHLVRALAYVRSNDAGGAEYQLTLAARALLTIKGEAK